MIFFSFVHQVNGDHEKGECVDSVMPCLDAVAPPDESSLDSACRFVNNYLLSICMSKFEEN